jgi:putative ABC transport system ATP-binding protein
LRNVDVAIRRGELVVLQGPSGSGKTTLINLLGLLDRPDAGTLHLDGRSVDALGEDARADLRRDRFGFVFQTFNLVAVLTAAENVEYPMMLKGIARDVRQRRALELLSQVGLSDKRNARPDLLSGGQRQRIASRARWRTSPKSFSPMSRPPASTRKTADGVLDLMSTINRDQGVAFVVSSHDPRVAARAQRTLTLHDGQVVSNAAVR